MIRITFANDYSGRQVRHYLSQHNFNFLIQFKGPLLIWRFQGQYCQSINVVHNNIDIRIQKSYATTGNHTPLCETVISKCDHNHNITNERFYSSSGVSVPNSCDTVQWLKPGRNLWNQFTLRLKEWMIPYWCFTMYEAIPTETVCP